MSSDDNIQKDEESSECSQSELSASQSELSAPQSELSASQSELTASQPELSASQRARIERNRQKALLLRQSRLQAHPYATDSLGNRVKAPLRDIDTGAGFFIETGGEEEPKIQTEIIHPAGPVVELEGLFCEQCGKEFMDSYFYDKFDELICDTCRLDEDKFPLITKTEAKNKYLLKDADLDRREPMLMFVVRKNPHNQRWCEMKLYLESQVTKRAIEVWESLDNIEIQKEKRAKEREKSKQKKFDKKVKELRLSVRSSLIKKDSGSHQHEYGEEIYDDEEDMYSKTCITCKYVMTYEKM